MPTFHNKELELLARTKYTLEELQAITSLLKSKGTFEFPKLENGLFPAAGATEGTEYTGHSNVWVRDNVHVAFAHYIAGDFGTAVKTTQTLKKYFMKYRHRFEDIIRGESDPSDPMNRPHIRFNGEALEELDVTWPHAQNDALGGFLWLYSLCARTGHLYPQKNDLELIALFILYFQSIGFHSDEDSGHWEEARAVHASSVGMVLAGLQEARRLLYDKLGLMQVMVGEWDVVNHMVDDEIQQGVEVLNSILPSECVQDDPAKNRRYDAALLFLLHPVQLLRGDQAEQIVLDVAENLQGEHGIKRYLGDSYWCADYRTKVDESARTGDFSNDMALRDSLLNEGEEAQWTIFDSTISKYYGHRFHRTKDDEAFTRQTEYLNRALAQVTGDDSEHGAFKCTESYFLENGVYVSNDVTPLLWSQANLMSALQMMKRTLTEK